MDQVVWSFFVIAIASSCTLSQEFPLNYNLRSIAGAREGMCPDTQNVVKSIRQDVNFIVSSRLLPMLGTRPGYGACGCGGTGWRRVAYLNMSDPTQTCPPAWELITTPRRSCARPSNATSQSCYSAVFPTRGIQYFQVCGRIIGYQVGQPQAFYLGRWSNNADDYYVDGVSVTYENPRQHIWTFANAIDEYPHQYRNKCPCTNINEQRPIPIPSFVGNDYFCETGVPPGHTFRNSVFYPDDPLWDGQGCGPTSACCTFNNPPWFCKQLPQSTNADLEVRLCSNDSPIYENTPVELIEIYVKYILFTW